MCVWVCVCCDSISVEQFLFPPRPGCSKEIETEPEMESAPSDDDDDYIVQKLSETCHCFYWDWCWPGSP